MLAGHYGVSFLAKAADPRIPLWALFIAVQLLDVFWAPLVLLGVEKVRIVPGITASNPFDLYFMPYTHSLVAAVLWSLAALVVWRAWHRLPGKGPAALLVALAVFSHWVLDFVVHRPDLPLYDDTVKVGLGLWNRPAPAFILEAALLLGGMVLYLRGRHRGWVSLIGFGLVILAIQAIVFFGPPLPSGRVAAGMALATYCILAVFIAWWERRHVGPVPGAA